MAAGRFTVVARDTTEPSPLSHEVINAKPYAFLDDAPLEERRTQAVITRRGLDVKTAEEFGKLDQAAIDRVKEGAWPEVASADELHDALLVMGAVPIADCGLRNAEWQGWFEELRGRFTPRVAELEWCERRLLARIHRYTLDRLRREIEPVSAADFMRFLCRWQRAAPEARAEGPEGLAAVLELLDGYEAPAGAWESDVLPARLGEYDPLWLDGLCLSGEIAWGRLSPAGPSNGHRSGPIRTTPVALFRRERGEVWRSLTAQLDAASLPLSHSARAILDVLDARGASFFGDLVNATGLLRTEVEKGLGELVAWGLVTSDSFAGLRALLVPSDRRRPIGGFRRRGRIAPVGVWTAGRRVPP